MKGCFINNDLFSLMQQINHVLLLVNSFIYFSDNSIKMSYNSILFVTRRKRKIELFEIIKPKIG